MTALAIGIALLSIALSVHAVIYASAARWSHGQVRLWRQAPDVAARLEAAPPWYVRYARHFSL